MYTLTLILAWTLTGPVAELDSHQMFVDTLGGQIHLTGFASKADCMNYVYDVPVTLNGAAQPYSITKRTCTHVRSSGAAEQDAAE